MGKSEGKTYKFFDQLQALENNPLSNILKPPTKPQNPISTNSTTLSFSTNNIINPPDANHVITSTNIPSTTYHTKFMSPNNAITTNPTTFPTTTTSPQVPSQPMVTSTTPQTYQTLKTNFFSSTTSSSTASDEELGGGGKRKRKWKAFFAKLTKDVIRKQEELQAKFFETVERHERERISREESWRTQEMARINRKHEILLQERSASTAKDNALIAFLQKVSVQGQYDSQPSPISKQQSPQPLLPPPQHWPPLQQPTQPTPSPPPPPPPPQVISTPVALTNAVVVQRSEKTNVVEIMSSSNRWPKAEVQALISLRASLDLTYQENGGAKGTPWEEVSIGMQKLGYNRNAKKCKEKWENINKYFKKVKDSNKKRGEDSKTCPYFHQLDALYKEKNKNETSYSHINHIGSNMEPLMVRPEQQWPPPPQQEKNMNEDNEGEEEDEGEEIDDDDDDEEEENGETEEAEEGGGGGFEVVVNKPS